MKAKPMLEMLQNNRRPVSITFTETHVMVTLDDGLIINHPLNWYQWLADASDDQRADHIMGMYSINFDELDDGLDIEYMLRRTQSNH